MLTTSARRLRGSARAVRLHSRPTIRMSSGRPISSAMGTIIAPVLHLKMFYIRVSPRSSGPAKRK